MVRVLNLWLQIGPTSITAWVLHYYYCSISSLSNQFPGFWWFPGFWNLTFHECGFPWKTQGLPMTFPIGALPWLEWHVSCTHGAPLNLYRKKFCLKIHYLLLCSPYYYTYYTVQGSGRARASTFFLALDPGPQGQATVSGPGLGQGQPWPVGCKMFYRQDNQIKNVY